jgi:hypothetical protein
MATTITYTYDVGDKIRCSVHFATVDGVNTDPTTITFKWLDPSGNEASDTFGDPGSLVVNTAVGYYHRDVSIDEEGQWFYRWEGTGVIQGAGEKSFLIRDSKFTA